MHSIPSRVSILTRLGSFNSLSRDHPARGSSWPSLAHHGHSATFNSLSRDHTINLVAFREAPASFNSLSRDHPHRCYDPSKLPGHISFNSLSRDHLRGCTVCAVSWGSRETFNSLSRDHGPVIRWWASFRRFTTLSTPSLGITLRAENSPRHGSELSTPSLGITKLEVGGYTIHCAHHVWLRAFNSLSRDHGPSPAR
jgi:hypothetical protein